MRKNCITAFCQLIGETADGNWKAKRIEEGGYLGPAGRHTHREKERETTVLPSTTKKD
jgi:hypothetical protein